MLHKLYIRNFALIDMLELELGPGFNALTGETGAGKSIIIDAVDIIIGGQGLTEFIRSGSEKAIVEGVFEISDSSRAAAILEECGLQPDPGEPLILSRELVKSGKNACRVNGRQVNLSLYREIAATIVDIYGQHHQQSLLDPQRHIELLDGFGGETVEALKLQLKSMYDEWAALQLKIKSMEDSARDQARMADVYRFHVEEIDKNQLTVGEDIALEEKRNVLAHAEKLSELCVSSYELIYGGDRQKPATDLLHEALAALREAAAVDDKLEDMCSGLESALYQIEETAREIKDYADRIEADPERLEEVENRLSTIRQLKKKFGDSIEEILAYREQSAASLAVLDNFDEELAGARSASTEARRQYDLIAGRLTEVRKKAAAQLKKKITGELSDLNMPHVSFEVLIEPKDAPGPSGAEHAEFLISPNKGEPLKPLAKIVSGGEMSRIMLAFKAILARTDSISTMIFDEVDTGIGGTAVHAVAQKLALIGRDRQVICVTHSPQIAACGDSHYRVLKEIDKQRTVTQVKRLTMPERVEEIARMLAGGQVTAVTRKHAEEILNQQALF